MDVDTTPPLEVALIVYVPGVNVRCPLHQHRAVPLLSKSFEGPVGTPMELLEVRVAVRVIVTQIAKAGKGEEMARAWSPRLPEVWSEPGCEQYEIFRSTTRPDVVVLMERWSTEADFDKHKKLNSTRGRVAPELRASVTRERYGYSVIGAVTSGDPSS